MENNQNEKVSITFEVEKDFIKAVMQISGFSTKDAEEAMNGLARAVFFGKQGELRERDLQDQLQRASALNILINAISIWNTVYLEKAVEYQKKHKGIDENLLKHISPLNWTHINFLGEYSFQSNMALGINEYRPLKV